MQRAIRLSMAMLLFLGLTMVFLGCGSQQNSNVMKESTVASQKGVNMTGTWYLQVDTARGSGTPTLEIKQEKTDLSGTYSGAFGSYPLKGSVDGNKFMVAFKTDDMDIKYSGIVNGDSIEGEVDFGGQGKGQFVGER